jgi:hypothetical protein
MAVLSDHHWRDPITGLREMARVAKRVVVFQFDGARSADFWLVRDYLPEFIALGAGKPTLAERAQAIGATVNPVPIPWDCVDGFFHAYWRRPRAYLEEPVRRGTSVWTRVGRSVERRVVTELGGDLDSGAWERRNRDLRALDALDLGACLLIA